MFTSQNMKCQGEFGTPRSTTFAKALRAHFGIKICKHTRDKGMSVCSSLSRSLSQIYLRRRNKETKKRPEPLAPACELATARGYGLKDISNIEIAVSFQGQKCGPILPLPQTHTHTHTHISPSIKPQTRRFLKNVVFWDKKPHFLPPRRHITSPLQSPAG
jgi:hypothetical protein